LIHVHDADALIMCLQDGSTKTGPWFNVTNAVQIFFAGIINNIVYQYATDHNQKLQPGAAQLGPLMTLTQVFRLGMYSSQEFHGTDLHSSSRLQL